MKVLLKFVRRFLLSHVAGLALITSYSVMADTMVYRYHGPESSSDVRYAYHWEVLRTALDKTVPIYGPYEAIESSPMTEDRQLQEVLKGGLINMLIRDPSGLVADNMLRTHIPISKGLLGYRILLISKGSQPLFSRINNLQDLQAYSVGQHQDWVDVKILQDSGFNVVTGSSYEGLFKMLTAGRFDMFSRGVTEIMDEYIARKDENSKLHIEDTLLLYFPLPLFYWFQNNQEGQRLAERIDAGMEIMLNDGSLDTLFVQHYSDTIVKLKLAERTLLYIDNNTLKGDIPFDDKSLWFDLVSNVNNPTASNNSRRSLGSMLNK